MKKINKILIGTHNKGKIREISYLLNKKIKKNTPFELKIKSPKETGKNFKENSILKANYFNKKTNLISLSDDSGLQVKCLNNRPGIYSARWAKKHGSFNKAMQKILVLVRKENKLKKRKNRKATFVCCLSIKFLNKKIISVEGKINGILSEQIKGKNGFGYDSIFIPQGKKLTFGQMNKRKKMQIDHRYIAFKKLKKKIKIL